MGLVFFFFWPRSALTQVVFTLFVRLDVLPAELVLAPPDPPSG